MLERYCFTILRIHNPLTENFDSDFRTILVCQGHTCNLSNSVQVLVAFQVNSPPDIKIVGCGCLGQCGNGPMVLILPEQTWYSGVSCEAVTMILEQHLQLKKPVASMLYRKFHPLSSSESNKVTNYFFSWLIALSVIITLILGVVWIADYNQY